MSPLFNDVFLKACRSEHVPYTPVWFMRQAGRYQAEYRSIREHYSFFEISRHPEVCAQVTRLPVEKLGVDAAILFADIMTPLKARGLKVEIVEGVGPVFDRPIRSGADVAHWKPLDPSQDLPYVLETVDLLHSQLDVPLIGFAGAPFTLASYLIEGGPSKNYHQTKAFMYAHPEDWAALMDDLSAMTLDYLLAQIHAGAQAVQLFDSWVGAVSEEDYRKSIAPAMNRIFSKLKETEAVTLYFATGAGHLLTEWNKLPVDVLSFDWRTSANDLRRLGITKAVQGNLDPALLLAPQNLLRARAQTLLDQFQDRPGYIFNLGHGVFPEVKEKTLRALADFVHTYTSQNKPEARRFQTGQS
ncbi:uroporphyrinogen decarboxylase [Sporolactobacillus sp. CPB3-1]|uniref:Uroporphyrinogen decarboxylase n=1 Tax=Sporolactobacillus mangiferae TaxID=2940498 RepID=A0ABT0MDE8_9BACL|nr:uroporphyrinogen decarboxylase [Sporolactobacillus mangiferae]MCL1632900.1 uroporphyrinogen decarboxylase [Sporolactobacillus mangiferae]